MLNKLKADRIAALKEHNDVAKSILSLLYSDSLVIAKKENRDVCDSDIISASKSLIKHNTQTIDLVKKQNAYNDSFDVLKKEISILRTFLPVQMTEEEIHKNIDALFARSKEEDKVKKNQGNIMKILKQLYGDTINMGIAAKYVSSKLK